MILIIFEEWKLGVISGGADIDFHAGDPVVAIDPKDIDGEPHTLHPETVLSRFTESEEHTLVVRDAGPAAQSFGKLGLGLGSLDENPLSADSDLAIMAIRSAGRSLVKARLFIRACIADN